MNVKTLLLSGKFFFYMYYVCNYYDVNSLSFLKSLTKDPTYRPTPARMLQHPFILKWENVHMDLGQWVKEVWAWN